MALNPSGPISLGGATVGQSINLELGLSGTATVSLNAANVRSLAGVPSGQIIMPTNFWGKSDQANLTYTFAVNTTQTVITLSSLPGYKAGKTNLTVTINAGILVYSNDGTPALTITGGTAGDTVTVVNNGYIAGAGGGSDSAGGNAISLGYPATINNTSPVAYIGGGGGGGGSSSPANGGGGAGGGVGSGPAGDGGFTFPGVGGAGGAAPFGGSAAGTPGGSGGGGAGYSRAGSGHNPICQYTTPPLDYGGGGGGGWGASGGRATTSSRNGASGGSGSAAGNNASPANGSPGQAGGKAVALNGNSITWTAGDTTRVYGSVS